MRQKSTRGGRRSTGWSFTSQHEHVNFVAAVGRYPAAAQAQSRSGIGNGHGSDNSGRRHARECGDCHRHPAPALRRPVADGRGNPPPARQHHHLDSQPAARCRDLGRERRGSARRRRRCAHASGSDHSLRRRHLAGRPHQRAARRPLARLHAHEPHHRRQRARPRCCRGARRLEEAAQRLPARHGPVLPGRSRRRGSHHRRHGVHARLRHNRLALRHHARERAQHHRRDGRWLGGENRPARAQVVRRL